MSNGLTIAGIFVLGVGLYFLSAILPGAITNIFSANTTTWDAGSVALWAIIPLAVIAAVVLVFVPRGSNE